MLISHRRRFIFTKTQKTAGTSVELYFEPWCMPEGSWEPSEGRREQDSEAGVVGWRAKKPPSKSRWWNHMPAATIREQIGPAVWDDYFTFCTVRNPFDKAVSAFYFYAPQPAEDGELDRAHEQDRFSRWLAEGGPPDDRDKYLIEGRFVLDDVVRYESLHTDLARVCRRVGVPWEPARLERYKSGVRPPRAADLSYLYTRRSRQLVEDRWADDLARFGYDFPAPM